MKQNFHIVSGWIWIASLNRALRNRLFGSQFRQKKILIPVLAVVVVVVISSITQDSEQDENSTQTAEISGDLETSLVVNTPISAATETPNEQLLEIARSTFAIESNRGIPKITSARIHVVGDGSRVAEVQFAISERSFRSMIARTARADITDLIEAIYGSTLEYDYIAILGSYSMQDVYGNSDEAVVVRTVFAKSELLKVNWGSFDSENVYKIADSQVINSSFR